jgi:hypothetical protein
VLTWCLQLAALFGALANKEAAAWHGLQLELEQVLVVQSAGNPRIEAGRKIAEALLAVKEHAFSATYKALLQRLRLHLQATGNVALPGAPTAMLACVPCVKRMQLSPTCHFASHPTAAPCLIVLLSITCHC